MSLKTLLWALLALVLILTAIVLSRFCGGTRRLTRYGGGGAVVFINGLGDTKDVWEGVVEALPKGTSVFRRDRPGTGERKEEGMPASLTEEAALLHQDLQAAGEHGPYTIVGHSGGALLALTFFGAYPGDVKKLVLVDPTPKSTLETLPAVLPGDVPAIEQHYMKISAAGINAIPYRLLHGANVCAIIDVRDGNPKDLKKLAEGKELYPHVIETRNKGHWIHKVEPTIIAEAIAD